MAEGNPWEAWAVLEPAGVLVAGMQAGIRRGDDGKDATLSASASARGEASPRRLGRAAGTGVSFVLCA